MTFQAQDATVQAQAMTTQANREVPPRVQQLVSTMASWIRDLTLMNPPTLYGSKVDEVPQQLID